MRESKQCLDMPVLPKDGSGWYLKGIVFDHRDALEVNSDWVIKTKTPKNLSTSPGVVAVFLFKRKFADIKVTIIASWLGRNINRK